MKLTLLFAIALSSFAVGQRNPNPCAGVVGNTQFRNDWSSCADYFWCNNEQAIPVPTPCEPGFGFDQALQACTIDQATCARCPPDGNLAVSSHIKRYSQQVT